MKIPNSFDYTRWDAKDTAIFEKFSEYARQQVGRKAISEARLNKLRACVSSIVKITKKPAHESLTSTRTLRDGVLTIQNAPDYSPESKRDYIKFLARLFYFLKTGDGSLAKLALFRMTE